MAGMAGMAGLAGALAAGALLAGCGHMMGHHMMMMHRGSSGPAPEATAAMASGAACPDITQELVDRGRQVYAGPGNCFSCHGGDAAGTPIGPSLTDDEWLNVDGAYESIAGVVRTGVGTPKRFPAPMPPMGGAKLSEDQVCSVAAYVYSLSH